MKEWSEKTLGEFVLLQRGHDLPTDSRGEGKIPVVGSFGITGYHNVAKAKGPGVTVGRSGASAGTVVYIDQDYWPHNTCLFVKDFLGNNPRFAYYLLSTLDLASHAAGSAQPSLNRNHIAPLPLWVPERAEQDDIASVLSALDDKIELNRRMNETLEALAQAIFQDWFVTFGPTRRKQEGSTDPVAILGGLIPDPTKAAPLAALFPDSFGEDGWPEGWGKVSLLDLADWVNGAAYKNMHFVPHGIDGLPVIKIAELKAGVTQNTKFTNTDLGQRHRISNGELLFSWSGNPDTSIDAFIWTSGDGWLNQHIFAVRTNGKRTKPFLYFLLKSLMPEFAELARNKQTTGLGHVTKSDMSETWIPEPPRSITQAFSDLIEPTYGRIVLSRQENDTLAETRDYLLPKLMSGAVRVRDAEAMAG